MAKFITLDNLSRFKENVDNIIPTKTSELENDSDFAVKNDIPDISDLANKSDIPTKTSELENDSNFAKQSDIPDISDLASRIDIPTKTSEIENDSGYITADEIPTDYAKQSDIPTKTSELENDSNFAKQSDIPDISNLALKDEIPDISHLADRSDIPTKTSQLINDRNFAIRDEIPDISNLAQKNDVPTRTSQLTNDMSFVNNTVNNLVNYYSKTQTYTKDEINTLVNNIRSFDAIIVEVLPTSNISTTTIYLKAKIDSTNNDYYNEYLYINDNWELIGNTKINLDNYYTKTQITDLLNAKANTSDIPTKVSELTNDKNYVVGENGKGLSANDYTDAEKNKLSVLQNYDDSELRNSVDKKAAQSDLVNLANEVYEWEAEIDNLSQNKVDKTITVNGQPLDTNVQLTIDDIGFTETDPTVPDWAKKPNKPTYEYSEILNTPVIPEGSKLYDTTGPNTDGSMTQKAVTDKLGKVDVTNVIPSNQKQYLSWFRNTSTGYQYAYLRDDVYIDESGNLNDVRGKLASQNDIPVVPDLSNVAYLSDIPTIPTTLPNPYSFTVNGVSYNGSSAKSISGLLQDSGFSKSGSGYMKFSNGFIIQWTSVTASSNKAGQSFSFPTAFPSACLGIAMNHQINSVNDTDNMSIYSYNNSSFTLACGHGSAAVFNIIAVGY